MVYGSSDEFVGNGGHAKVDICTACMVRFKHDEWETCRRLHTCLHSMGFFVAALIRRPQSALIDWLKDQPGQPPLPMLDGPTQHRVK